jgi:EmrB/QacA subfamily drug resistance transporter
MTGRAGRVLAIACLATFMVFLDTTIVNIAFPDLRESFEQSSLATLSWVINAYAVVFAALLMPAGRYADAVGRRRVFLFGTSLFAGSSMICAAAPTAEVLIGARVVQGAGAAAMLPTAFALLLPEFPPEQQGKAIAAWGAAGSFAAAAGPSLGGLMVDLVDWRLVFIVNVPIGAAALISAARVLREDERPAYRRLPDLLGTVLVAVGVGLVTLGITKGEDWGWTEPATLASLVGGVCIAVWALLRARRHPVPAIDTSLWRIRPFAIVNLASLVFGVGLFAFLLIGVLFLTTVWGYSVLEAGLAVSPGAIGAALVAPLAARLCQRRGVHAAIVPGGLLFAGICLWVVLAIDDQPNFVGLWLPTGTLGGIALGLSAVGLATGAAASLPPPALGAGIALNQTARQLGGALGIAALVALLSADPGIEGFLRGWAMCGLAGVATALVAARLRRRRPATAAEREAAAVEAA